MTLVIDCHGHYTTAPAAHNGWRDQQKIAFKAGSEPPPYPPISDDEIRETLEKNQLRLLRERGADMTIFSPRASAMAHHVGDEAVSKAWARANNDLIARCVELYPETFRSEEHTSELQSRHISYAVFCLKKKKNNNDISKQ